MEHVALYRQFRPMTFDEIVEQKAAVTLKQAVLTNKIGHAYLFSGQRGTGKTSIARVFSRAINCESPVNGNPCNSCPTCKGILDGTLMDVIEIDAASNTSVENIRKISEEVNFAPTRAPHKVYIIDEVHMISQGAFNALLKTLEEPPSHAVFLFATTEPHRIPVTVLSRCQRYKFERISAEAIIGRLKYICEKEKINADDDALRLISSLSDGAMRDAISILDQAASSADGKLIKAEDIENVTGTVDTAFLAKMSKVLITGKFDELLPLCEELAKSGRDTIRFALDLGEYFRNLLIIRTVPNPTTIIPASATVLKEMYDVANLTSAETLVAFISAISSLVSDLRWSPSVRTSFEIGLIRICGRKVKADVVPLTVPDFATLQAKAVADMSNIVANIPENKPEVKAAEPEPPKAEPETVVVKPAEPIVEPVASEPVVAETPKAEPTPEPMVLPVENIVPPVVPSEIPEEEKEDEPLENQIDLFSLAMSASEPEIAPAPEPIAEPEPEATPEPAPAPVAEPVIAKEPEPVKEAPKPSGNNVFANLASSFLLDGMDDTPFGNTEPAAPKSEPEVEVAPEPAPSTNAWEVERSSLANILETTPIAKAKPVETVPVHEYKAVDTDTVWNSIISRIQESDYILYSLLSSSEFRILGDGAYIVFEEKDKSVVNEIKTDPNFKQVSVDIKTALSEIAHVYLCTEMQYQNALKKSGAPVKQTMSKAEELIKKSKQLGINTEIHFGDN